VGGLFALPFVLETKVVLLEHQTEGVRERALALFAGKAQRAIGLRGEVVILITSSRQVQEMNHLYRKKNEPTDVLSFPSQNPKLVGDIAISAEIAASNAAEMGHWAETELRILILHGLLHLAGYDHETDTGEMHAQESKLRRQFGLPVGLIERTHGEGIEKPLKARQRGKGRMSKSAAQPQPTLSKPLTPAKKQGRRR
jgi:probable rRNA maturation factor